MKEVELEIGIILGIGAEIGGDESAKMSPLLKQKIGFKSKVYLQRNLEAIEKIRTQFYESVNELILKFGEENSSGEMHVPQTVKRKGRDVPNEKFSSFKEEYEALSSGKISVQLSEINLEDISFEDEAFYPLVTKYLIK